MPKAMAKSKEKALAPKIKINEVLGTIRAADVTQVESQLEIARLLTAIKQYKLYHPTFKSFEDMVKQELDFPVNAAIKYVSLYTHFLSLGYGREELLKLMRQVGWRVVQYCLARNKKKMGYRAMLNFVERNPRSAPNQININVSSDIARQRFYKVLQQHGMLVDNKGQRKNVNVAFESMLADYVQLQKKTSRLPGKKRKLSATA